MFDSSALLRQRFAALRSTAELFSLRHVKQSHQSLSVRRNVAEPPYFSQDEGAMLTVRVNGVEAYAATADLSQQGLQRALEHAESLARQIAGQSLLDLREQPVPSARHDHVSPNFDQPLPSLADCLGLLAAESASVPKDSRLVDWQASLSMSLVEQTYLNSAGAELRHAQRFLFPGLGVTASDGQDLSLIHI